MPLLATRPLVESLDCCQSDTFSFHPADVDGDIGAATALASHEQADETHGCGSHFSSTDIRHRQTATGRRFYYATAAATAGNPFAVHKLVFFSRPNVARRGLEKVGVVSPSFLSATEYIPSRTIIQPWWVWLSSSSSSSSSSCEFSRWDNLNALSHQDYRP